MRCGPVAPDSLKLNFPLLSALVLAAISIPVVRLMRMTSSPAAGLLAVPMVMVAERVWAGDGARGSEKMAARNVDCASFVKSTPLGKGTIKLRPKDGQSSFQWLSTPVLELRVARLPLVNYDSRYSGCLYRCCLFGTTQSRLSQMLFAPQFFDPSY